MIPTVKLGKLPPKYDERTLRLARFVTKRKLPKIPQTHILSKRTLRLIPKIGVMGNDDYGDCTFASIGHSFQSWSVFGGKSWSPTARQVINTYLDHTGGKDEGAVMLDVLNYMRKTGMAGNKIYAYVAIDPLDHDQVRTAHFLFGNVYFGANLPRNAQDQTLWDLATGNGSEPGSWGGHAMNVWDLTPRQIVVPTWGELQPMTWTWWDRYVDEAYTILEEDYLGADNRSPQGFSLNKLAKDLLAL